MSKDEPIDVDAEAKSTDGRGSSDVGNDEIDLRDPVSKSQVAKADSASTDGVSVDDGRPAPPPRPADAKDDLRPDPPKVPASGSDAKASVASASVDNASVDKAAADVDDTTEIDLTADADKATNGRTDKPADTSLIDMGETIADADGPSNTAWWKYAAAIVLPVAVAIGLVVALTGRGNDDAAVDATRSEGVELATGTDSDNADEIADDAQPATDAEDTVTDDAQDTDAASDTDSDAAASDADVEETVGEAVREEEAEAASDAGTSDDAAAQDDAEPSDSERPEANPTEVPDPTPEPDVEESAEDSGDSDTETSTSRGSGTVLGSGSDDDASADDTDSASDDDASASDDTSSSNSDASSSDSDASTSDDASSSDTDTSTADDDTASADTNAQAGFTVTSADLADRDMFVTALADYGRLPAGTPIDSYTGVEHDSGNFAVSLPSEWTSGIVARSEPSSDRLIAGAQENIGGVARIEIRRFEDGDADEILAEDGPTYVGECATLSNEYQLPGPAEYAELLTADRLKQDDGVTGSIMVYEACSTPDGDEYMRMAASLTNEDGNIVLIDAVIVTDQDRDFVDRAISTITF